MTSSSSGYTPTDRLAHSMTLMQAFAYRHGLNLRVLLGGDPVRDATNPVPDTASYIAAIERVQCVSESLRAIRHSGNVSIQRVLPAMRGQTENLGDGGDDLKEFRLLGIKHADVDFSMWPAIILATIDNETSKTAFRTRVQTNTFDAGELCLLPLAAAGVPMPRALHLYELIEGLPAFADVYKSVPAKSISATVSVAHVVEYEEDEDEDEDDGDDDDETSDFSADTPPPPKASRKRKTRGYKRDGFCVGDEEPVEEYVAAPNNDDDDDSDNRPLVPKKPRRVVASSDDEDVAAESLAEIASLSPTIKQVVQARRSASAQKQKKSSLPIVLPSDVIRREWRYDFIAAADEDVGNNDEKLFDDFLYWLNASDANAASCTFYTNDVCAPMHGLLANIGTSTRTPMIDMLCRLVVAGRVVVVSKQRATFTGQCSLCAGGNQCKRCYIGIRVTLDGFSEAERCAELGIVDGMMRAAAHCGERFMRVAQVYWLLNAVRWQSKRSRDDPVVRAAFLCITHALEWAQAAPDDVASKEFSPADFNAGPLLDKNTVFWSRVGDDQLHRTYRNKQ